jgi:2-C-methyl-D-erythritol 4-phosphate cytidylyltransferase/2-C-methyl-D-erythritol 2,4-cyclodiphosphate synthase
MVAIAAIIPAAGNGSRMGLDHPKQYHLLAGVPVLVHTVRAFAAVSRIQKIIVAVPAARIHTTQALLVEYGLAADDIRVVAGGARRQDSVKAGLDALDDAVDVVLVHDAARPLLTADLINRCCDGAIEHGAVIAAVPVKDTLKKAGAHGVLLQTVDREDLWQAQTPQAFRRDLLLTAYQAAGDRDVTDEASLLELAGIAVHIVEGSETNIKITRPDDLIIAETTMQDSDTKKTAMRIGHGYDAHRFAPNRDLVLGGVKIPNDQGLAGHSDADVLTHALCDALLGALGEGDIGAHFPDTDVNYANIYSIRLLEDVAVRVAEKGFVLCNADITVVCQSPRLAPFVAKMRQILADACGVPGDRVNVKATTTEKMGFTGRVEGISCHAVVLLEQRGV